MKSIFYIFLDIILAGFIFYSCANPVAPSGGEKDILEPQVVMSMPASGSVNYQGENIEILFDEYITFSASEENLLITPSMPVKPSFVVKGKKLIIKLPDNLDPSVTYSISLMEAVKDFREGNTVGLFKYVFSRGPIIDSASINGSVKEVQSNSGLPKVFVGLYHVEDTGILKMNKPVYLAPTNSQGVFDIDNVKEGWYVIAALEDKNFNYIFDQVSEKISIPSNPIYIGNESVLEQEIRVFENESEASIEEYKLLENNKIYFAFTQELENIALDVYPYNELDKVYLNSSNDTLFYHLASADLESVIFDFTLDGDVRDSVLVSLKQGAVKEGFTAKKQWSLESPFVVQTLSYIESVDQNNILVKDSLGKDVVWSVEMAKENLNFSFEAPLNTKQILLQIDSGAIHFYDGSWNQKSFMKYIEVQPKKETSKLLLTFSKPSHQNVILELYKENKTKIGSYKLDNLDKLAINNLQAGVYFIKVFVDQNANGKWTTGNFEKGLEPESILFISKEIEIKENWDKDLNLNF